MERDFYLQIKIRKNILHKKKMKNKLKKCLPSHCWRYHIPVVINQMLLWRHEIDKTLLFNYIMEFVRRNAIHQFLDLDCAKEKQPNTWILNYEIWFFVDDDFLVRRQATFLWFLKIYYSLQKSLALFVHCNRFRSERKEVFYSSFRLIPLVLRMSVCQHHYHFICINISVSNEKHFEHRIPH